MIPKHNLENFDPVQNKFSPMKKKKGLPLRQVLKDITKSNLEEERNLDVKVDESNELLDTFEDCTIRKRDIRDI